MRMFSLILAMVLLTGCNSVYMKPNTLDSSQTIFADRGGYTMQRAIKERMEQRGYKIVVGKAKSRQELSDSVSDINISTTEIPSQAKYIVRVEEFDEKFAPMWCAFNGFWWWHFNVSIANQVSGEEILTWRGYGCPNSSLRKLDKILDKLEMRNEQ